MSMPKMLQTAGACLFAALLTAGCAAGSTPPQQSTGSQSAQQEALSQESLQQVLNRLPERFSEKVTLTPVDQPFPESIQKQVDDQLRDHLLFFASYTPDYGNNWGGWLCSVFQWTQAELEQHIQFVQNEYCTRCFARDDTYYYGFFFPTDVRYSLENEADYNAVYDDLTDWLSETILSFPGMRSYDPREEFFDQPYRYDGNHMNVYYKSYTDSTPEEDRTSWELILAQPVTQGDGGIWCVEQIYDNVEFPENSDHIYYFPKTDFTADEYYQALQKQADSGESTWALEPTEVCLQAIRSLEGDDTISADRLFDFSSIYSTSPHSGNMLAAEEFNKLTAEPGTVTIEWTDNHAVNDVIPTTNVYMASDAEALRELFTGLTENFSWIKTQMPQPLYTDPWGAEGMTDWFWIYDKSRSHAFACYAAGRHVVLNGTIFYVSPDNGEQEINTYVRSWFQEHKNT